MNFTEQKKAEFEKITHHSSLLAAEALSKMLNKPVEMQAPNVKLKSIDIIDKVKNDAIVGICEISGDLQGNVILCYSTKNLLDILSILLGKEVGSIQSMNEEAKQAFTELLNIIGGTFLSAIANKLDMRLFPNPPKYMGDAKTIESELIEDLKAGVENIFLIDTELKINDLKSEGNMYMLLHTASLDYIMSKLK